MEELITRCARKPDPLVSGWDCAAPNIEFQKLFERIVAFIETRPDREKYADVIDSATSALQEFDVMRRNPSCRKILLRVEDEREIGDCGSWWRIGDRWSDVKEFLFELDTA
ncbi:hypothetical protein GCM10025762_59770 [Haloechinothrix salitolerans]